MNPDGRSDPRMPEHDRRSFEGADAGAHEHEKIERLRRAMYSRSLAARLRDKPRRMLEQTPPLVGEDWKRPEPDLASSRVAPATIGLMRSLMKWMVGASAAFFIGAAGFFGYYFFIGSGSSLVSPGNIDISISGPLQVQSGEPTELQISVVNRNRAPLELADLVVKYPDGTRSSADLSTDLPDMRRSLGTIEPGGRRQGTVSAVFAGFEGDRATIDVELEYRLKDSSAIFVANSQYQITFASSPISVAVEANDETVSGQPMEFRVTVASNADAPVRDVLLSASVPFGFSVVNAEPKMDTELGSNMWSLGDLLPGQRKVITLRGSLSGEQGDQRVFRFTAGTRKNKQDKSISSILADYGHTLTVARSFLGLAVTVNRDGGSSGNAVVAPGETVNVSIAWENNLPTSITDAVIVARLSGVDINGATVRSVDGFYRSSDRAMLWDKTTTGGSLGNIAAGARGTVTFSFQAPPNEEVESLRNPQLLITVNAAAKRVSEEGVPESLQATALQSVRLATDLQLIAQGLYYGNPLGSSGPMPPKAESETTYGIVFSVTNTTNEIRNARVKATLPPYVRWVGIHSPAAAQISFNQNDSTLTWEVGTIEPGVGVGGSVPEQVAIVIGFTPSQSQIGQQPPLIQNVTLTGSDAATGAAVTRLTNDVTTNIVGDPGFSAANATVVK